MAGAPLGNQNAVRAKKVREAIMRALSRRGGSIEAGLDQACEKLVRLAIDNGEQWAMTEIFNRLDGKPATIVVGDADEPPIQITGRIKLVRPGEP